jgi:WD40 repeat protein
MLSEKMNAHHSYVMSVAFSPYGTKIVSGSCDKTIKVWDSGAP